MAFNLSALTAQQQAAAIYIGYYDRAPDPYGMDFWEAAVRNPLVSLVEIATYFSAQEETYAVHPFFVTPSASAANAFISELYLNLFNRAPDVPGLTFWSGVLQQSIDGTGPLSVGEIILAIIEGAQNSAEGQDITTLLNKIEVANAWTDAAEAAGLTAPNSYGDSEVAQASAKSIINDVTFASSSVDTAKAEITSTFENFVDGSKFTLTTDAPSILEGDSGTKVLVFKATLDEAPNQAISVNYETLSSGTAASGDDFIAAAGVVTFAPGQTVATVSVTVLGDATFEADETIQVKFSGARLTGDVTATGTITNDDLDPQVALGAAYTAAKATYDAAVAAAATSSAAATDAQTAADLAEAAVNSLATANAYSTAAQAAQTAAVAAQADAAAVVTAAAAVQAAAAATLSIADDADVAGVSATALAAKAAADTVKSVADAEVANAVAQIANYTGQTYTLSTSSPSITEGDTGTKNLTFTLTLDEAPTKAITINYQTLNSGTATAGDDFNVAAGSVEFAAGQTVATVSVIINADTDFEGDETVQVQFSGDALDAAVTATGTITENDVDPDTVLQTFTLTTGADNLTGTSGDDTFVGEITASTASTNTVGSADEIAGGAGTDTLNITVSEIAGPANLAAITSTAVEKISVRNVDATPDAITVSGLNFAGATEFVADRSTAAIVFNDIGTADLTIAGNDAVTNDNVTFNGSQTASVTDALTVNVQGGVNAGVIVSNGANDDWTAVTINSTGGTATATTNANVLTSMDLAGGVTMQSLTINATSSLTTGTIAGWDTTGATTANKGLITITGAGAVNVGTLDAAVEDVVATDNSGGVTLTASTQLDFTFAGSSGNDRVTTGAVLGSSGSVDAAGGTGDRLIVANSTHVTETVGARYSNFEVLQVANGVTVDLDHLSANNTISAIRLTDGGVVNDLSATQAANVTVTAGGNSPTIAVKGAGTVGQIDTVKITADDGASATSTIGLSTPVIADVEKLELTAVDNITVAALTSAEALNSITLDGAGTIGITSGDIVVEANTVVDGSAATGALTLDFGGIANATADAENAMLIIGGSAGDTITTSGAAADLVNGKGGIDSITITDDGVGGQTAFADVQSDAITSADADLITGFVTAQNDFDYNGALSNGTGAGAGIAAGEIASAASVAAALATADAANDIVFFVTGATDGTTDAAVDAFVAGASATTATAIETALLGTGGTLNGAIVGLDTTLGTSDAVLFVFSDAGTGHSLALRVTNADQSTTNTLTADEIEVIGVFNTATLVAGDII